MTAADPVFAADGRPVPLGERIGGGGEGEVFAISGRSSRAIKIYWPKYRQARGPKITAMVSARLHERSRLVAFPIEPVFSRDRVFHGFSMRRVVEHKPIFQLYGPTARKRLFAHADFAFLVRAAANAARAVAGVHFAGCVVGDLNESGLLVSDNATVALIDADSFQIGTVSQRFLCGVGKEEYTAPELRGLDFATEPRTQNHDAFALAVLLFQVLAMGKLPFAGMDTGAEISLGDAIREHRFAYSQRRRTGLTPPRGAVTLTDFSPMLAAAFESAFQPVGTIGLRPRAMQWVDLLERFEAELVPCAASARHVFHPRAGACTWCRVAAETGFEPF